MPKATSPFLASLRGTLKGGPTFRDNPQTDAITMQTKPVPTDRRTAKQAAVRDAYSRLAYLWKNLSHLDKEPYEIMAERRNLTPWNCWLSFHMPIMRKTPLLYLPFVEGAGTTVQDFAINGKSFTLNGTTWAEKNNIPCISQDGIDDLCKSPTPSAYTPSGNFTLLHISTRQTPSASNIRLLANELVVPSNRGFVFFQAINGTLSFRKGIGASTRSATSGTTAPRSGFTVLGLIYSGAQVNFYLNGTWESKVIDPGAMLISTAPLGIGGNTPNESIIKGTTHMTVIFPSAWTPASVAALDAHYRPFFT